MSGKKAEYSDSEFIDGLKTGNGAALKALYKKYYNIVLKIVVNNSGGSEAAQDVYQETIIVLFENVQKPGFELNCQLQTYIYSVAKHLWLKHLRNNGRVIKLTDEEHEAVAVADDLVDHMQKEADLHKMSISLEELGEPCKTIITDFYMKHLSMDEISEKFGYTNSDNAKTQKYKCLQRLKKSFFGNREEKKEHEEYRHI